MYGIANINLKLDQWWLQLSLVIRCSRWAFLVEWSMYSSDLTPLTLNLVTISISSAKDCRHLPKFGILHWSVCFNCSDFPSWISLVVSYDIAERHCWKWQQTTIIKPIIKLHFSRSSYTTFSKYIVTCL